MRMKEVILDTNVLLNDIDLSAYDKVIIPITVTEELDKIKHNSEGERNYKARKAIRKLEESNNIEYCLEHDPSLPYCLDMNSPDNRIIAIAKIVCKANENAILLSNDLNMICKAKALDIPCERYDRDVNKGELYKGYKIIGLSENELANWYEQEIKANMWDLEINEYILFKVNGVVVDKYRWTKDGFVKLKIPNIKGVRPLNDLQQCAFDLVNSDVPVKILLGKVGSGKTLINVRSAIHLLDKGKFQHIMYLRNPVGKGKNIGFLPGNKLEKLYPFCSSIIDNLDGGEIQFQQLINQDKLSIECSYFIKGASKENTWFCLDEGEDLDVETLKLIGTRLAKNSVLCISADLDQTEKEYRSNNGLCEFIKKFKGNPLIGIITLEDDVRSEVSKLFGEF